MQTTKEKIIEYIKNKEPVSAKDLIDYIGISKQAIFVHLKNLIENKMICKIGTPPKVFYALNKEKDINKDIVIDENIKREINNNFLYISPIGEIKEGFDGFVFFCNHNNLDPVKTANEYINTLEKYNKYKLKNGLIDGMHKIKSSFKTINLDKLFYLDFYAIERFGKTKLGQLLLYSKQSQNKKMIKDLSSVIKEKVMKIIKEYDIDAVCFIPPTVKREIQLMKELENNLKLPLKKIKVVKIKSDIAIPQKTLNKIKDRIENAEKTFLINDKGYYKNILIIDDAVGSGATLNIVAGKIKQAKLLNKGKIIGLAITGSFKGFDVISEV